MSDLATAVDEYLRTRQALGFKLKFAAPTLRRFVTFLESRSMTRVTTQLALRWACQPTDRPPSHWARRLGVIRTVDDLVRAINIALGDAIPSTCDRADVNGDELITIDELLKAVGAALNGCIG